MRVDLTVRTTYAEGVRLNRNRRALVAAGVYQFGWDRPMQWEYTSSSSPPIAVPTGPETFTFRWRGNIEPRADGSVTSEDAVDAFCAATGARPACCAPVSTDTFLDL